MLDKLKENWTKINGEFIGTKKYYYLTPLNYRALRSQEQNGSTDIKEYIQGIVLDLGAGKLPARHLLKPLAKSYISFDRYPEHPELDAIGDAEGLPFKSNTFDTIYSNSVFEHLPRPWKAAKEISRVLKEDGKLILTIPHIYYIHGEPHDYFRYTGYGLKSLFEDAGLHILSITSQGGFISFISSLPMTLIFSSLYRFKPLFWLYYYFNKLLIIMISKMDDLLGDIQRKVIPMGFCLIAEKTKKEETKNG